MKLLILPILVLAAAASPQETARVVPPAGARASGMAARINDEIITWDEVELTLRTISPEQRTPDLRRNQLRTLAERMLFLQEAKKYGITVPEAEVDGLLETERKRNGWTSDQLQRYINSVENMSISEYRDILRKDRTIWLLFSRLVTEPLRNPNSKVMLLIEFVSPEEMREYYANNADQFKAIRQMDLVRLAFQFQTPEEKEEKIRLAQSIRRKHKEGAPLYYLAVYYMDINLMPRKEGKSAPVYENLTPGDSPFSKETTEFLFETLKEGETSDIIMDGNTVNLFNILRKVNEKDKTFEEAQPFIRKQLESAKRRYNQKILRDALIRRSFVEPADLFK
ncbi:MAG TPA: peptidylprolyl isomerase [Planctomycetota bacterium]|nr:peptidylprolyl isomerase [Planctomycetota bacterium]